MTGGLSLSTLLHCVNGWVDTIYTSKTLAVVNPAWTPRAGLAWPPWLMFQCSLSLQGQVDEAQDAWRLL